jgi:carbon monoxide dehydrogenase subunit G
VELENSFVVTADIETAWRTLLDIESVAPCMPGAALTSFGGDQFTATVKVKLGPVTMMYNGKGRFVSKDQAQRKVVIEGVGKETRGTGTAKALVTTQLVAETPHRTRVDIITELTITGKAAQFGRGVISEVSKHLIDDFAGNLDRVIQQHSASKSTSAGEGGREGAKTPVGALPIASPSIKVADSINLIGSAGAPILKRAVPVLIGLGVLIVAIIWLARR